MANGEAGFNLGLNKPGDGSLGLGTEIASAPVAPSDVNNLAANVSAAGGSEPLISQDMRDILAAGLLSFGANDAQVGINAVQQAKNRRAQQKQLKRQNMVQSLKLGTDLAANAALLPKDQRSNFIQTTTGTLLEAGDETSAKIFQSLADRPDRQVAIGGLEETPIGKQLLQQDPTGQALTDFAVSPQGAKVLDQITDQQVTPAAFQKVQGITGSLDKLARDGHIDTVLLERVRKDNKISIPEMQQLAESMPEGHPLKLGPAEIAAVTADRNMETLRSTGIALAEDFEPEDRKLQAQDNIVDKSGNFVGVGVFDPKEGFKVQTEKGLRSLKDGERTVSTAGSLEDTGLVKKVAGDLQGHIVKTTNALDRLDTMDNQIESEFLTVGGSIKGKGLELADRFGIPLSEEFEGDLKRRTEFFTTAASNMNQTIKDRTGATMTQGETERLIKEIPNPLEDGPVKFRAKMAAVRDNLKLSNVRARQALSEGLDPLEVPLAETRDQILNGDAIQRRADELINQGMTSAQAVDQIRKEFPTDLLKEAQAKRRGKK